MKVTSLSTPSGERITTPSRVTPDLRASLRDRAISRGHTVRQFFAAVLSLPGVYLDSPLGSVEVGIAQYGSGRIFADRDEHGDLDIREAI